MATLRRRGSARHRANPQKLWNGRGLKRASLSGFGQAGNDGFRGGSVAAGRHFDFCLLPPLPQRWEVDILVDLRDRFGVTKADALRATRSAGLREPYERAFAWRLMLRAGRAQPPHPVAPFARLRQVSSG
jgi:hypothetical protein